MGIGWRAWVAAGLVCIAPVAAACRGGPQVEAVGPGIVRILPQGVEASSWVVLTVVDALPPSALRARNIDTACTLGVDDGDVRLFEARVEKKRFQMSLSPQDRVFGLGDKSGPLDRRGRVFTMWNTDAYAWDAARDPLYKSIPFFIVMRDGKAFGVFVDNTSRAVFDVGKTDPDALTVTVKEDEIQAYVIAGPTPRDVLRRYTDLTGRMRLPPKWALGFQQSRYTYLPEARVREVAKTLRDKKIPADAIWLDIGFQDQNKPFTVDRKAFPDFEQMIGDLRADGFRTVLITDMHIAKQPGYAPYDSGKKMHAFVQRNGEDYVGKVWPGESVFPDFARFGVRFWWGRLYTDFVRMGVAGFWNDMNEPSVFDGPGGTMPDDVVHYLAHGQSLTHAQVHNVYGLLNSEATYRGLLTLMPDERPFVLTRAAYAGSQRSAATWTGDNTASWHHLGQSVPNILSLGLSGMALAGDDIGGFIGSPPPDLLTRWYQLGAWQPLFRSHAATDTRGHEVWVDGPEHEALRRAAIERRYRLMPYLYSLVEESTRTGAPITRPVWFEYPEVGGNDRDFLFGRDLFVAPVVSERLDAHVVQLPPGTWYGFDDGKPRTGEVKFDTPPREVPVFVRAGAIVPMQPLVQHTGETPQGPLEVHVWAPDAGGDCSGTLYDDDGRSWRNLREKHLRMQFACEVREGVVVVTARAEHAGYAPWWKSVEVVVHREDGTTKKQRVEGTTWTVTAR